MKLYKYLALFIGFALAGVVLSSCGRDSASINSPISPLIISPLTIGNDASKTSDAELVSMLKKTLYSNAMIVLDWTYTGTGLDKDESRVLSPDNTDTANYVLIKNIQNISALKANCELVFSKKLLESSLYPILFEGDTPLFVEENSDLYFNINTGGAAAFAPDFTRAKVLSKKENVFEIEVPMTSVDNQDGEPFKYIAIRQNGNWVLDSYYYF